MILKNLTSEHHSFLISLEGIVDREVVVKVLEKETEDLFRGKSVITHNFLIGSFHVDLAREIKAAQESKTLTNERRVIIIGFDSITTQAQNALLKVLEEPSGNTYFFILTPNESLMLDTVRSRCVNLEICPTEDQQTERTVSFLEIDYSERLEMMKRISEERSTADTFFANLESEIAESDDKKLFSSKRMRDLLKESKYYTLNGSPTAKYLLEELSLTLPIKTK